jgi:hypothetical protein
MAARKTHRTPAKSQTTAREARTETEHRSREFLSFELKASPTLSPNDHARMLIELLRPTGVELARRWLAALQIVPIDERESVVAAIEHAILQQYTGASAGTEFATSVAHSPPNPELHVVFPPVQRDGYVEQVIKTYEHPAAPAESQAHTRVPTSSAAGAG